MKIQELIEKLAKIQALHGPDVEVAHEDVLDFDCDKPIDMVRFEDSSGNMPRTPGGPKVFIS